MDTSETSPIWSFMAIFTILVSCGQAYTRDKKGVGLLKEVIGFLEGKHNEDGKKVGRGIFDNDDGSVAEFWDGIPLKLFSVVFNSIMNDWTKIFELMNFDEKVKKYYEWVYHAGFTDGDGCISGNLTTRGHKANLSMAIGKHTSYHQLLVEYWKFKSTKRQAKRTVSKSFLADKVFVAAFANGLVLKQEQFRTVIDIAGVTKAGASSKNGQSNATLINSSTKLVQSELLSHLNYSHGNHYMINYFRKLFSDMIEFEKNQYNNAINVPLTFLMYVAGLIGADGGVGYGHDCCRIEIYQSCLPYLLALAEAIHEVMGFDEPVKVQECTPSIDKQSANSRGKFRIMFTKKQSIQLLLTVGALDYNRRSQHTVALVAALVDYMGDAVPEKKKVREFLHDLLRLIRVFFPSKGWRWTLINALGHIIHVFWHLPCP